MVFINVYEVRFNIIAVMYNTRVFMNFKIFDYLIILDNNNIIYNIFLKILLL